MKTQWRFPPSRSKGLTFVEVLISLVILGIISVVYMQSTNYAQRNATTGIDWQAESVVIEKTIENLRVGRTVAELQAYSLDTVDASQGGLRIQLHVRGGIPPATIATDFSANRLAMVTVTAKRETYNDSITVTTYLWLN